MTLGDPKVPYGLWRALGHKRKDKRARIILQAAYGFGHIETASSAEFSEGWTEGEKKR